MQSEVRTTGLEGELGARGVEALASEEQRERVEAERERERREQLGRLEQDQREEA